LTVVKEICDNSLDACEDAEILPEITVRINQKGEDRFKVAVQDNGPGIIRQKVPRVFGKLLYGSKFFHNRQQRGQQGIGVSAAVLYSQLTTGKPVIIRSRISKNKPVHEFHLRIDTTKNEPHIIKDLKYDGRFPDNGIYIEMEIEGSFKRGRRSVDEYIKQTALANPAAKISYRNPYKEKFSYPRVVNKLPKKSKSIKPHPYGVELGVFERMAKNTRARSIAGFINTDFSRVSLDTAKKICKIAKVRPSTPSRSLGHVELEKVWRNLQRTKLMKPPLDCLSPIGQSVLEKAIIKDTKCEFVAAITRPPAVYRGNPFGVECCTKDTKLVLETGEIITIKDYIEQDRMEKVFSMDKNFKMHPARVLAREIFENKHKILRVVTKSGRELKITANNKMPILENGKLIWKRADEIEIGKHVAVPRRYNILCKTPKIIDLLNPKHVKIMNRDIVLSLLKRLKMKYGTFKNASEIIGINYERFKAFNKRNCCRPTLEELYSMGGACNVTVEQIKENVNSITIVDNNFPNPVQVNLPEISEELLYIIGLLDSDGHIARDKISFVNTDNNLHKLFKEKIEQLFGIEVKRYRLMHSTISNKTIYVILSEIKKRLSILPNNLIISWLKGVADGDGWVILRNKKIRGIGIATAKKDLAEFVQTLLLRLDIQSKIYIQKIPKSFGKIDNRTIITKKDRYNIIIQNFKNISKFYNLISFRQTKRANKIYKGMENFVKSQPNHDVVPIGILLRKLREENNIYQHQFELSDCAIRNVELGHKNITRPHLQQITKRSFTGDAIQKLTLLAFSDILWDKIIRIEDYPHEEYVYDLTMETGNFVANNIVMHNCSIGYGGELPPEGNATIARIANRVPLIHEASSCAITKAVKDIDWRHYRIEHSNGVPVGPFIIMVHMYSTWIPYTSEGKEAIDAYPEISKEIKLAVQDCARKMARFLAGKRKRHMEKQRQSLFEKYIPELAISLENLSGTKKQKIISGLNKIIKKPIVEGE